MKKTTIACSLALLLFAVSAHATTVVTVPSVTLLPNTPNQIIAILVTGDGQTSGMDLNVQIDDGGVAFNPGTENNPPRPKLTGLEVKVPGFVFSANVTDPGPSNPQPGILLDQFSSYSITTASGFNPATGGLARLTIDTTGVAPGSWPLIITGTVGDDSLLYDDSTDTTPNVLDTQFINGVLSIVVPEPSSLVLAAFSSLAVVGLVWRRRLA
jgi:hypothetical protein